MVEGDFELSHASGMGGVAGVQYDSVGGRCSSGEFGGWSSRVCVAL